MIRTLVVLPNWVGDTVMALPVLEALAADHRHITALAKPHLESLLALSDSVGAFLSRAGEDREVVERIAAGAFDEGVVLPNSFRSALWLRRAGIRYRWGYRGNWRSGLLSAPIPRPKGKRQQIEDYRELLEAMQVPLPPSWLPRIELDPGKRRAGAKRLRQAHLDPEGPLVGHFAGAEFGPSKRWPMDRFAELTRALRRQRPDLGQALIAGPAETWLGVRIHEESGRLHPLIGPDLDLGELAGVLSHFDLLVTNDSGPMHLAAALGVPCVALFGPTDPERTAPAGPDHRVLHDPRWCSPCFRRRCPLLHHRCLKDLTVERVADAALDLLADPP